MKSYFKIIVKFIIKMIVRSEPHQYLCQAVQMIGWHSMPPSLTPCYVSVFAYRENMYNGGTGYSAWYLEICQAKCTGPLASVPVIGSHRLWSYMEPLSVKFESNLWRERKTAPLYSRFTSPSPIWKTNSRIKYLPYSLKNSCQAKCDCLTQYAV